MTLSPPMKTTTPDFDNLQAQLIGYCIKKMHDKTAAEDNKKSEPESGTNGSEAAADDEKKSSEAESKPLEPFVPSEKIPGDQAVDFPVDI